tara:strand:+ start:99878 stop:100162 length:285 start_codon:yes stop_codon:yes gene_type:complete
LELETFVRVIGCKSLSVSVDIRWTVGVDFVSTAYVDRESGNRRGGAQKERSFPNRCFSINQACGTKRETVTRVLHLEGGWMKERRPKVLQFCVG